MSSEVIEKVEPITDLAIPVVDAPKGRGSKGTGTKIDKSPYRFEVVRMLQDNLTHLEIVNRLKETYQFSVNEFTLAAFKKHFYPYYKDKIDRVDKERNQHLIARITDEMKEAATAAIQEVYELNNLFLLLEERISRIRTLRDDQISAAYETVLKELIKTKAQLLERMTRITGSTGMEGKLRETIKATALAAQKTLIPYLIPDKRDDAFALFEGELLELIVLTEASVDAMSKPGPQTRVY